MSAHCSKCGDDLAWDLTCARCEMEKRAESAERQFAETREALAAPVGFIEALAHGQYAASPDTVHAARHFLPIARRAVSPADTTEGT